MGQAARQSSNTEPELDRVPDAEPAPDRERLRQRCARDLGEDADRAREAVAAIVPDGGLAADVLLAWIAREVVRAGEPLSPHREELRRLAQRLSWRLKTLLRMAAGVPRAVEGLSGDDPGRDSVTALVRSRRWEILQALRAFDDLDSLDPERFDLLADWVEEFEQGIAPTTLHFLLQSVRESSSRMVQFMKTRFLDLGELADALTSHLGGGPTAAKMLQVLGTGFLRTKPVDALARMRPHFDRWSGIVLYYQDEEFRSRCPQELAHAASDAYTELLRRIVKSWRTELRSVDAEDAVQETITRLVGEGLRTYRYESNLLNYLAEVATDFLRRQYHRPKACELVGDEPIVDTRPTGPAWARARDRLARMREMAPEVIRRKFKASNWPVADRIWEEVLREAHRELEGGADSAMAHPLPEPTTDEELAEEIAETTGRCVSVPNLRVIRSRLRTAMGEALGLRSAE